MASFIAILERLFLKVAVASLDPPSYLYSEWHSNRSFEALAFSEDFLVDLLRSSALMALLLDSSVASQRRCSYAACSYHLDSVLYHDRCLACSVAASPP